MWWHWLTKDLDVDEMGSLRMIFPIRALRARLWLLSVFDCDVYEFKSKKCNPSINDFGVLIY
jgi:hypothetical protein